MRKLISRDLSAMRRLITGDLLVKTRYGPSKTLSPGALMSLSLIGSPSWFVLQIKQFLCITETVTGKIDPNWTYKIDLMKLTKRWQVSSRNFWRQPVPCGTKGTAKGFIYGTDSTELVRFRQSNVKCLLCLGLTSSCFSSTSSFLTCHSGSILTILVLSSSGWAVALIWNSHCEGNVHSGRVSQKLELEYWNTCPGSVTEYMLCTF